MTNQTTTRTITLPTHTDPETFRTGGLSVEQVETLLAAIEPGVEFIAPMDGLLSDARRPRTWTILVSRGGKLSPMTICPDGRRVR